MADIEELARIAIDCGFHIHKELGPGLLESVYEMLLAERLSRSGYMVERQKLLPVEFDGLKLLEGYRVDLLVDGKLIIEVKSVERIVPVHSKQLLTYIRLARQPVGLLMNFGGATFREGLQRIVNGPADIIAFSSNGQD
jgi:GxxExxY protein